MAEGTVFYAKHEGLAVLKLVGAFAFSLGASKTLDAFIDKLFVNDDFDNVLIDLTETENIDSTNLGLLAIITRITMDIHDRKATIISTNDNITDTLDGVGFREVFNIVNDPLDPDAAFEALNETGVDSSKDIAKMVLNAHRELVRLSEENKSMFTDVVEMLELQLGDDA